MIEDVDGNTFSTSREVSAASTRSSPRKSKLQFGSRSKIFASVLQRYPYEGYVAVAEKLNALAPGKFAKKTLLVNSGAEAVEKRRQNRTGLHQAASGYRIQ